MSACSGGAETIVDYYCWLVWCERKILFWLEIYDRLRPNEQAVRSAASELDKISGVRQQ